MPYIIRKTNGQQLTNIGDATLDNKTDLALPGRNYAGYGLVVNENFVSLLENFSNSTQPKRPIQGQLWYNSDTKNINLYDGSIFKSLASVFIQSYAPTNSQTGDLWWDTDAQQLRAFNGSSYTLVGPPISNTATAFWVSADVNPIQGEEELQSSISVLEGYAGGSVVATISDTTFAPDISNISESFPKVYKGITIAGADQITGISANSTATTGSGYLLWGTAAHALLANTARAANAVNVIGTSTGGSNFFVPFGDASSTGTAAMYVSNRFYFNPGTNVLYATAVQAAYADIAERYEADAEYSPGTVLMVGGEKEVTLPDAHATTAVAGVVSTQPGYMLNSDAGSDSTHPFIALKGRVPCKVIGPVKKGDLLVASGQNPGSAVKMLPTDNPLSVVGKALEDLDAPAGIIEIKV